MTFPRNDSQFFSSFTDVLALLLVFFIYLTTMTTLQVDTSTTHHNLDAAAFNPVGDIGTIEQLDALIESIQQAVLFDVGSPHLTESSRRALTDLVPVLQQNPAKVIISGHSDKHPISRPVIESNWHLSALRAASVAHFFEMASIPKSWVSIIAHGDTHPHSDVDDTVNRRVDIRLEAL
jgi:flagellar motor protein MotB